MKNKPLKFKIFLIFIFPLIAFFYLSYFFIQSTYKELDNISYFNLSTKITSSLSSVLHELQIERGLSSGYITRDNKYLYKQDLITQHTKTDKALKKLFKMIGINSNNKTSVEQIIDFKEKPIIKKILKDLKDLKSIRNKVINAKISFIDEISYYSSINKNLIISIKLFNTTLKEIEDDAAAIVTLQELKEFAGLERAYTYNILLSNKQDKEILLKLEQLHDKQDEMIKYFLLNASTQSINIYNNYYDFKVKDRLDLCRNGILNRTMGVNDADKCFNTSSDYINIFSNISNQILNNYKTKTTTIYENSLQYLYITAFICALSFLAIFILAYILIKLVNQEEKNTEELKKAKNIAEHQADHDFLTALLNRKSLIRRLNEEFIKAKRHKLVHAFLFIDLDHFKSINDNYGHDVGDKLIIETSKRLRSILRQEDIAARISGDEFGIVLVNLGETEAKAAINVKQICTKILKEFSKKFTIDEHTIHMTLSIGIKIFPDHEKSVQDIMIHADKAMYKAKKHGKNKFIFFNNEIENELKKYTTLEKEINDSIQNNDFVFFYQAKLNTVTNNIVGAELLARWQHPTKGLLYPDSFIDMAEKMGVTQHFSTKALEVACDFIKSNSNTFDGTLAINISSHELLHPNFENKIISLITKSGIKPEKIELEITESMIIEKFDVVIKKIKHLQDFGVQFSIDDFGTGFSSITYLQKLPVNTIKIDREFLNIEESSNKELVKMIANIAATFNMQIVAEGIETNDQLEFINSIGAQSYQGYYFSKAIDEQSFKELL